MRLVRHERVTVELEKTDYHLANYPGADRTEAEPFSITSASLRT